MNCTLCNQDFKPQDFCTVNKLCRWCANDVVKTARELDPNFVNTILVKLMQEYYWDKTREQAAIDEA